MIKKGHWRSQWNWCQDLDGPFFWQACNWIPILSLKSSPIRPLDRCQFLSISLPKHF
jgi:hypothetical protein